MFQFPQKLRLLFRPLKRAEEQRVQEIVSGDFERLRSINPDTHQQWLRLHRTMTQRETETSSRKLQFLPRFALGVAVVAIAMIGGYIYIKSTQLSYNTFATGRGEQKEVVLNDGSQVILNHTTELVVAKFQPSKPRRLSLAGEAYFHARRGEVPFIVSTPYAEVHVVGTEFDLRAREGMLEVAVINGVVKVSVVKDGIDSSLFLSQRQRALCPQNNFPQRIDDIPSLEYPGWVHGKLFFNKTPFLIASREIEMRFDITITINDQDLRRKMITGILDARTARSALTSLCELTGKRFAHEGQAYTIY